MNEETIRAKAEDQLPSHMVSGVMLWIMSGIRGGGFLNSIVVNDLAGAMGRADHINKEKIPDYVSFFYNDAPSGCWGSHEKASIWEEHGGLKGAEPDADRTS